MASTRSGQQDRPISRRFSSLAFRPQTSHTMQPSIPQYVGSPWQDFDTTLGGHNHETQKRTARDVTTQSHAAHRMSAIYPSDALDDDQNTIRGHAAEFGQQRQRRGSHGLLSFGKSIVRRASTTLAGPSKPQRGNGSVSRTCDRNMSQNALMAGSVTGGLRDRPSTVFPAPEHHANHRPITSAGSISGLASSTKSKSQNFLRRVRSSVKYRRDAASQASGQHPQPESSFRYPMEPAHRASTSHLSQLDWPRARPGAAARASAREASSAQSQHPRSSASPVASASSIQLPAMLGRSGALVRQDTKCTLTTRDSMLTDPDAHDGERDSMIFGMSEAIAPDDELRKDPLGRNILPAELCSHVLSFLDYQSLVRASAVSKAWREHASSENHALWKEIFLRRFQPKDRISVNPLQMGGDGIGTMKRQPQDWCQMYKARVAIERNWRNGTPNALYFQGHTDSVYCAQYDENKIITGSRDRTIRVWDINTYKCLKVIGGPNAKPESPPANDVQLEIHHFTIERGRNLNGTPEGDCLFHTPADFHTASVLCLQFDKEIMVTGSSDSTCIVWDITDPNGNYQPIRRLVGHSAGVLDVCFDDRYIVSCSKDNDIRIWSRQTGVLVDTFRGHRGPVNAVQMRGKFLVSASGDGFSKLWDLDRMRHVRDFHSKDRGLAAVEFSDDGKFVLAGGNDMVIYKYCVATGSLLKTYRGHTALVRSLFLDTQNNRIISGSYDQSMRVFDFTTGDSVGGDTKIMTQTFPQNSIMPPTRIGAYENWTTSWILSAKSDFRRIVATSQDGRALLMDFGRGVDRTSLELLKCN